MEQDNIITWFDIPTTDFRRAVKFYSDIFQIPIQPTSFLGKELAFFPVHPTRETVYGDIVPPDPAFVPSTSGVRIYFNCGGNIEEVLNRVEQAGGKVMQQIVQIEGVGLVAFIQDSEGNMVGLHDKIDSSSEEPNQT